MSWEMQIDFCGNGGFGDVASVLAMICSSVMSLSAGGHIITDSGTHGDLVCFYYHGRLL